jgi:chromosome segregation ATPase
MSDTTPNFRNDIKDVELEVGLLKKDVQLIDRLCAKLSESIEKTSEVSANLAKMITLHEQKHEQHEKVENELKEDIKDLHARIDEVERHISSRIDSLKDFICKENEQSASKKSFNLSEEFSKYKWMVLGAAMAIGWIIGNINLTALDGILK